MEINFGSAIRNLIADILWNVENIDDARSIAYKCGVDGHVVFHMMLSTYLDEHVQGDFHQANEVLSQFQRKQS
jgi:hypothetical protein